MHAVETTEVKVSSEVAPWVHMARAHHWRVIITKKGLQFRSPIKDEPVVQIGPMTKTNGCARINAFKKLCIAFKRAGTPIPEGFELSKSKKKRQLKGSDLVVAPQGPAIVRNGAPLTAHGLKADMQYHFEHYPDEGIKLSTLFPELLPPPTNAVPVLETVELDPATPVPEPEYSPPIPFSPKVLDPPPTMVGDANRSAPDASTLPAPTLPVGPPKLLPPVADADYQALYIGFGRAVGAIEGLGPIAKKHVLELLAHASLLGMDIERVMASF